MSLIKGSPDLKFVVQKSGQTDEEVVLVGYTEFEEEYEPIFISHELQSLELRRKLKGFRYRATVYFEKVDGANLLGLAKIVHREGYDRILFYPNYIDKPLFNLDVTADDETIKLAYFYLLAQKDFTLKLIAQNILDCVPLALADFTAWGNISLQFEDLDTIFDELT